MSDMYHVGQVCLFPYAFVPKDFVECDGRQIEIRKNEVLYSLLSTRFGGDGVTYFCVPDLRVLAPKEMKYCICIDGLYPQRD